MICQLSDQERRARAHAAVDRLHAALLAHDTEAFAETWAPDGRMDFPFAPPGWPSLRSREEVRAYLASYTDAVDIRAIRHELRHETQDPDVLVLEWGVDGLALVTGRRYAVDYVGVLKVGDQGIEYYRDYWSALGAGHILGRLPEMVAAVEQGEVA